MDKFRYSGYPYGGGGVNGSADGSGRNGDATNPPFHTSEATGLPTVGVKNEPSSSPINAEDEGASSHTASSELGQVMEERDEEDEEEEDDVSEDDDDADSVERMGRAEGKDKFLDDTSMKMENFSESGVGDAGTSRNTPFDGQSNEASSTTMESEFQRRRVPRAGNRYCVVCSMPAIGYNFGRITCESCKTFFRRNALKSRDKIRPCANNNQCAMDGNNRKNCPQCRLRRCFETGMSTKHIQPPEKLRLRAKPKNRSPRTKLVRVPANLDVSRLLAAMDQFTTNEAPKADQSQTSPSSGKNESDQSASVSTSSISALSINATNKPDPVTPPGLDDLSNISSAFTIQGTILGQEKLCDDDNTTLADEQLMTFRATLQYILSEILRPYPHNIQSTEFFVKQTKDTIEDGFNTMAQIIQRFIPLITKLPFIKLIQRRTLIELLKVKVFGLLQIVSALIFDADNRKWRLNLELPDGTIMPILCDTTQMITTTFAPVFDSPELAFMVNVDKMSAEHLLELVVKIFTDLQVISDNDGVIIVAFLGTYLLLPSFEVRDVIGEDAKVALVRRKYVNFIRQYMSRKWTNNVAVDHRLTELIACSTDVQLAERIFKNCSQVLAIDRIDPLIFELSQSQPLNNPLLMGPIIQQGKHILQEKQAQRIANLQRQASSQPGAGDAAGGGGAGNGGNGNGNGSQSARPGASPGAAPSTPGAVIPPLAHSPAAAGQPAPPSLPTPLAPPPPRQHRLAGAAPHAHAHFHAGQRPQPPPLAAVNTAQRTPFPAGLNLGMGLYGLNAPAPHAVHPPCTISPNSGPTSLSPSVSGPSSGTSTFFPAAHQHHTPH